MSDWITKDLRTKGKPRLQLHVSSVFLRRMLIFFLYQLNLQSANLKSNLKGKSPQRLEVFSNKFFCNEASVIEYSLSKRKSIFLLSPSNKVPLHKLLQIEQSEGVFSFLSLLRNSSFEQNHSFFKWSRKIILALMQDTNNLTIVYAFVSQYTLRTWNIELKSLCLQ